MIRTNSSIYHYHWTQGEYPKLYLVYNSRSNKWILTVISHSWQRTANYFVWMMSNDYVHIYFPITYNYICIFSILSCVFYQWISSFIFTAGRFTPMPMKQRRRICVDKCFWWWFPYRLLSYRPDITIKLPLSMNTNMLYFIPLIIPLASLRSSRPSCSYKY